MLTKFIYALIALAAVTTAACAQQLPLAPTGDLYTHSGPKNISTLGIFDVFDLNAITLKAVLTTIPGEGITFDAAGNLYVGVDGLDIYDAKLNLIGHAAVNDSVSSRSEHLALRPPGQVFACSREGALFAGVPFARLFIFNTQSLQNPGLANIVKIPFTDQFGGSGCQGIAFDAAGHLWVTAFIQLIKLSLDAAGNPTAAADFFPGGNPVGLAFQPGSGRIFYCAVNENFIGVADPANPNLRIATITNICDTASSSPFTIAFGSSGNMFVSCGNDFPATTDIVAFRADTLASISGTVDASTLGPRKIARPEVPGGGFIALRPISTPTWPPGSALTASNIGLTSLTLNWTAAQDNAGITAYQVFQGGTLLAVVAGTVNTFNVTGLTSKTTYTFKVEACNAAGNCGTDGPSLTVTTLTAQQATQQLITAANGLVSAGSLNAGQGDALIAKLQAALSQLNAGNTTAAANELRAFINQVDAYVQAGVLSATQGQALRNQAQEIVGGL